VSRASAAAALPVSALAAPSPVAAPAVASPVAAPLEPAPARPVSPVDEGRTVPPAERSTKSGDKLRAVLPGVPPAAATKPPAALPAPFGLRLLAGLVDAIVLSAAEAIVLAPVVYVWRTRGVTASGEVSFGPILLSLTLLPVAVVLACIYLVYGWGARGGTYGQGYFDLRVEAEDGGYPIGMGRAWLRLVGYLLSVASLGVGFLMVAFTGSALHDRIAGTRVVQGRRS
jgi:uncharacterized RDD family membrane protein YckC